MLTTFLCGKFKKVIHVRQEEYMRLRFKAVEYIISKVIHDQYLPCFYFFLPNVYRSHGFGKYFPIVPVNVLNVLILPLICREPREKKVLFSSHPDPRQNTSRRVDRFPYPVNLKRHFCLIYTTYCPSLFVCILSFGCLDDFLISFSMYHKFELFDVAWHCSLVQVIIVSVNVICKRNYE